MARIFHKDFDFGQKVGPDDNDRYVHIGIELGESEEIERANIVIHNRLTDSTANYKLVRVEPKKQARSENKFAYSGPSNMHGGYTEE
jgi:hypothetical protein